MRGSIVKKGNKYYAVLAIGPKRKWLKGGDTKKDAERVLNENLPALQEGTFRDIKKVTFREFGKIWLDSYVKSNIKETAHPEYEHVVGRLIKHFGDAQLQNITGAHIQTFIGKRLKEIQPSTVQRETIVLKQMFKFAYQMGYTKRNPGEFIKNPRKPKKEKAILDIPEAYRLLDHIDPYYRVAVLTAILTGIRANELWGLTWDDVDFDNNVIRVQHSLWRGRLYEPKTGTSKRRSRHSFFPYVGVEEVETPVSGKYHEPRIPCTAWTFGDPQPFHGDTFQKGIEESWTKARYMA